MSELLSILSSTDSVAMQPVVQKMLVNSGLIHQHQPQDTEEIKTLGNFLLSRCISNAHRMHASLFDYGLDGKDPLRATC